MVMRLHSPVILTSPQTKCFHSMNTLSLAKMVCRCERNLPGSTMCADIVESQFGRRFDLADPVEAMQWMNCGALEKCGDVIGKGVRIAAEIILET